MRRILAALLTFATSQAHADCSVDQVFLKGDWGQARFTVSIADDAQERAQGLMHVETMPTSTGMLFIYDRPQRLVFWMKNTLIPLDMLFIDETGTVRSIYNQAQPLDLTPVDGGDDLVSVLEINGGLAKSMGITVGTTLRHPAFAQDLAAWPCD